MVLVLALALVLLLLLLLPLPRLPLLFDTGAIHLPNFASLLGKPQIILQNISDRSAWLTARSIPTHFMRFRNDCHLHHTSLTAA